MTEDDRLYVLQWIGRHCPGYKCQACGCPAYDVLDQVVVPMREGRWLDSTGDTSGPKPVGLIPVCCQRCRFVALIWEEGLKPAVGP